LFGLD